MASFKGEQPDEVRLLYEDSEVKWSEAGNGMFSFDGADYGSYTLKVKIDDVWVELKLFHINHWHHEKLIFKLDKERKSLLGKLLLNEKEMKDEFTIDYSVGDLVYRLPTDV